MSKKVSSLLFRINKFNNYKNIWIFKYNKNLNILLKFYYQIIKFLSKIFLNFKIIYLNNIYIIYSKLNFNQINYLFRQKFINIYKIIKFYQLNLFFIIYKLNLSMLSILFIKLFIKFNLLKYNSIQNLYNKLYTNILTEYMHIHNNFIGLKIIISGRLNNTKLASFEIFQFGILSLQKFETFIDYDNFYLLTKYGLVGVKIWLEKNLS